ncbi:hypothetical protein [Alkalicoccus luteus]|uniref:Uncharacterized protein n=1 Tax=Alkalicoccus luteus TaxID=1237094 RepID=A0A969PPR1_9BACI|nr:hypothetical protein [Alkalicoccus luteus]NJP37153.1 hypothetical protein [Alkalicoccus luteus]
MIKINKLDYPDYYPCSCGMKLELKINDYTTYYKGKRMKILDAPVYECPSGHIQTARVTKVRIKKLLKEAHKMNESEINYQS